MLILFPLLCFSKQPKRSIKTLHKETYANKYNLTKYITIKYPSLRKCFENEICKIEGANAKSILNSFDKYMDTKRFNLIKNKNVDNYLVDVNNPLTDDEKLAIFIYSFWGNRDFVLNRELRNTLSTGTTGNFNCYFEYFFNGLMKIKSDFNSSHEILYRGTKNDFDDIYNTYENLKVGDILSSTSFTSTTYRKEVSLSFYSDLNKNIIFFIHQKFNNSRIIDQFSFYTSEAEYIYVPGAQFKVIKEKRNIYCREESLNDCQEQKTEEYKYHYKIIELEEIGEKIESYPEEETPFTYSFGIRTHASRLLLSIVCFFVFFLL